MLLAEKQILWRISAMCLGAAMPAMLFERTTLFVLIILGAISGILATKGSSLRKTFNLLKQSRLVWLILAIMASFAVSSVFGINQAEALDKYAQLWIVLIVAGGVFVALREMPGRHVEGMMTSMTITTVICCIIMLVDALTGNDRLGLFLHNDWYQTPYRLNFYTGALSVILPFIWARMLMKQREGEPLAKMLFVPVLMLTLFAFVVSGARIGWGGGILALIVFIALVKWRHDVAFGIKHAALTLFTLLAGFGGYIYSHGMEFFHHRIDLNAGTRGFGGGRGEIWQLSWQHSFDNPLFGIGLQGFRYLPDRIDLHPHSAPLQLLLETGIIGLGLVGVFAFIVLRTFYNYAQHTLYGAAAVASFCGFSFVSLANTSIFNLWWTAFFALFTLIGWRTGWASPRPPVDVSENGKGAQ